MRRVKFHPEAEAEMLAAMGYYESQQSGLGGRFLAATQDATNQLSLNPAHFRFIQGDVRRCLIKIFPYGILFRELGEEIVIVAVMHLHRDPDYWRRRL